MGRRIQGYGDTFDPDTMKLLARAFDAAWAEVSREEASAQAEDRRTRLALVVLALAREGSRNEREIRTAMMLAVRVAGKLQRGAEAEIRFPRITERPAKLFWFVASVRNGLIWRR